MPERDQVLSKADSGLVDQLISSPNYGDRPECLAPDMIILHYTGMESGQAALERLCDEEAQVSSHYLIEEDGTLMQLVAERHRAWHAGKSYWQGRRDINSQSIGIEIVNRGHEFGYQPFPAAQMDMVIRLLSDILERQPIKQQFILAHSDVAPLRKEDPGELFDWGLLYQNGIGMWVEPAGVAGDEGLAKGDQGEEVISYQQKLAQLGFEITVNGIYDEMTLACARAFQRHYRQQQVDGIADFSTVDTLNRLLNRLGNS